MHQSLRIFFNIIAGQLVFNPIKSNLFDYFQSEFR